MENKSNKIITFSFLFVLATLAQAQSVSWTSSTEGQYIKQQSIKLSGKAHQSPIISMFKADQGFEFKAWGTTFNELNWDALQQLPEAKRKEILDNLFSPTGQLRFTRGRIGMNANDYARSWFSCDEVDGDSNSNTSTSTATRKPSFRISRKHRSAIPTSASGFPLGVRLHG